MTPQSAGHKRDASQGAQQLRRNASSIWRAGAACLLNFAPGVTHPVTSFSSGFVAIETGTSAHLGRVVEASSSQDLAQRVAELKARSGLTWAQIAQLFGVTRRAVHMWVDGGNMAIPNQARLNELHRHIDRSGQSNPAAVRQWFLSAERESARTRFAVLVGPLTPLKPEDGRRFVETLGVGPAL